MNTNNMLNSTLGNLNINNGPNPTNNDTSNNNHAITTTASDPV
jgi:hypothetical protein